MEIFEDYLIRLEALAIYDEGFKSMVIAFESLETGQALWDCLYAMVLESYREAVAIVERSVVNPRLEVPVVRWKNVLYAAVKSKCFRGTCERKSCPRCGAGKPERLT